MLKVQDTTIRYNEKDYIDALQQYISYIRGFSDVISVYQFGSVSIPGLSDIDLLIILQDQLAASKAKDYRIERFNKKVRYIFMHQPFILNEFVFQNLNQLFYINNLKYIFGRELSIQAIDEGQQQELMLVINIKRLSVLLRNFSSYISANSVSSRECLVNLNSLKYTIHCLGLIFNVHKEEWLQYIQQVENLRKDWFHLASDDANQQLSKLLYLALGIVNELVELGDKYLQQNYPGLVDQCKENIDFLDYNKLTIYTHSWSELSPEFKLSVFRHLNRAKNIKKIGPVIKNLFNRSIIFLPTSFAIFKSNNFGDQSGLNSDPLLTTLNKRDRIVYTHIEFLVRNGFDYGIFSDGQVMSKMMAQNKSNYLKKIEHRIGSYNKHSVGKKLSRQLKHAV